MRPQLSDRQTVLHGTGIQCSISIENFRRNTLEQIYRTGRGSLRVRSVYTYDSKANCIDVTQIPPSTTIEAIVEKKLQGREPTVENIRKLSDMLLRRGFGWSEVRNVLRRYREDLEE